MQFLKFNFFCGENVNYVLQISTLGSQRGSTNVCYALCITVIGSCVRDIQWWWGSDASADTMAAATAAADSAARACHVLPRVPSR